MSDVPILKDADRSTGRGALQKNIQAALALAGAVRSTLGPRGLDAQHQQEQHELGDRDRDRAEYE